MIRTYPLDNQDFLVGRAPACNIRIDSLAISIHHAKVKPCNKSYCIEQATEESIILVNHQPESSSLLHHGDIIQIGEHTIFFSETPATINTTKSLIPKIKITKSSTPIKRVDPVFNNIGCIQVLSGPHIGKMIPLQRSLTRLALSGNNCAVIAHRDTGYFLSHLEGESTPLVDNKTIGNKSAQLNDGSIIQIGDIRVRFHQEVEQNAASQVH